MSQKTFIETYKVEYDVCDKIIGLYSKNKNLAQAGRLGENPRVDKELKDSMDLSIPIQLYPEGGGYPGVHCERDRLANCKRALTWVLYLTDTPNGGTEFIHQELKTDCVKGTLAIFPSDMTHMHRGVISQTHEKMIFTGWIIFIQPGKPKGKEGSE